MRKTAAILFAIWATAACAVGGNATAPTAAPAPRAAPAAVAAEEPFTGPDDQRDARRRGPDASAHEIAATPPAPAALHPIQILTPSVRVVPAAYTVDAMPTRAATAAELRDLVAPISQWVGSFTAMLERTRHPAPGVDVANDLRSMFTETRLSTVVMRSLGSGDISGQPTLTGGGFSIDGAAMRAWGSPAYVDVTVDGVDRFGTKELRLRWRLRLQALGSFFRVIDLREPTSGAWVIGTDPRYSALELETEMRSAVEGYLNNESYSSFRPTSVALTFADTPFSRARAEAINGLNRMYAADSFRERYFENVSASIERFEPAWFGGDGVVTVKVTGRVVQTANNGTTTTESFVQRLKFLRTTDMWMAVDAQNDDGTWVSGGNLALAEFARPHG